MSEKGIRYVSKENDPSVFEIGTAQVRQMLRCALIVTLYSVNDVRMGFIFKSTFSAGGLSGSLVNAGVFLHNILETLVNGQLSAFCDMLSPSNTMHMLRLVHVLRYVEFRLMNKTLHANHNIRAASRAALVEPRVANLSILTA